jgi:ribosomal protein L37AE/L43A
LGIINQIKDDIWERFHPVWGTIMEEKKNPEMEVRNDKYREPPRCKRCGRPFSLTETEVGKIIWWCFWCESPLMK